MLGCRLRKLREAKGLTRKAVADQLSMTPEGYSYYETGKRNPSPDSLSRLADLYNVSTDYILGKTDNSSVTVKSDLEDYRFAFYGDITDGLTEDDLETVAEFAAFVREQRKKKSEK